jgi:hypothetical protein
MPVSGEDRFAVSLRVEDTTWHESRSVLTWVSLPLLIKLLIHSWGPYPMTSSNANYLPEAPPSKTINTRIWGFSFQHMNFGETHSNHCTVVTMRHDFYKEDL